MKTRNTIIGVFTSIAMLLLIMPITLKAQDVIYITNANVASLVSSGLDNGKYELAENVSLTGSQYLSAKASATSITLDLKDYTLSGQYKYVIYIDGAKTFTVNANEKGTIVTTQENNSSVQAAIRTRNGTNLIINGGNFISVEDGITIYTGGQITINGGHFNTTSQGKWGMYIEDASGVEINNGVFGSKDGQKIGLELIGVGDAKIHNGSFYGHSNGMVIDNSLFSIDGGNIDGDLNGAFISEARMGSSIAQATFSGGSINPNILSCGGIVYYTDHNVQLDPKEYVFTLSQLLPSTSYVSSSDYVVHFFDAINQVEYINASQVIYAYDAIKDISVINNPNKTDYVASQHFDPSGLLINVEYLSGKSESVSYDATTFAFDKDELSASDNAVVVTYKNKTASIPVHVIEDKINGIYVKSMPTKITYDENDTFNPSGLVIAVQYLSGKEEEVAYNASTFVFDKSLLRLSDTNVEVTYDTFHATIPVTVASNAVTGIVVKTAPNKTSYVANTSFDPTGLVISLQYQHGQSEDVVYSPTLFQFDKDVLQMNDTSVQVTYNGFVAAIGVNVTSDSVSGISIQSMPTKTMYVANTAFDPTGLVLNVQYLSGRSEQVPYNPATFVFDKDQLSDTDTSVDVTYESQHTNIPIQVNKDVATSLSVKTAPTKINYIASETFDPSGLVLSVHYLSGRSEDVVYDANTFFFDRYVLRSGDAEVNVSYNGLYTPIAISVEKNDVVSVQILHMPTKQDYIEGMRFAADGLMLRVQYEVGYEDVAYNPTIFHFDKDVLEMKDDEVVLVYEGQQVHIPVRVQANEVSSVKVHTMPSKVKYYHGEHFDPTGLALEVDYLNGTNEIVNYDASTFAFDKDFVSVDDTGVMLTYKAKQISIPIEVKEDNITKIEVKTTPKKLRYIEGDHFDPSGLELHVYHANGTKEEVAYDTPSLFASPMDSRVRSVMGFAMNDFSFDKDVLQVADSQVTITYKSATVNVPISVVKNSITSVSIKALPNKTTYYANENFDPSGLVIRVNYLNGTSVDLPYSEDLFVFDKSVLHPTDQEVSVSFDGYTLHFAIRVLDEKGNTTTTNKVSTKATHTSVDTSDSTQVSVYWLMGLVGLLVVLRYVVSQQAKRNK